MTYSKHCQSRNIWQIKSYLKMLEGLCSESMINFFSQHLSLSKQISLLSPKLFAFSWWDARMTRTMNSLNSYWKLFLTKQHLQQLVTGSPGRTGAGPLAKICPNWRRRGPIQPTQKVTWAKNDCLMWWFHVWKMILWVMAFRERCSNPIDIVLIFC